MLQFTPISRRENQCCYSDLQRLAINIQYIEKSSVNILQNIFFWVLQKKVSHTGLEQHKGEEMISVSRLKQKVDLQK